MGADETLFLPAAFPPAAPLARLMRTNTPRLAPMQSSLTLSSLAVQAPVPHLPVPDIRVRAESYERNVLWQRQFRAVRKFLGSFALMNQLLRGAQGNTLMDHLRDSVVECLC
jgi:hypothetical protein